MYKAGTTELSLQEAVEVFKNGEFIVNSGGIYQPQLIFKKVGAIKGAMPNGRFHNMSERSIRHTFGHNYPLMDEFARKVDYRNLATKLKYAELTYPEKRRVVVHLVKEDGISVDDAEKLIEAYAVKGINMPDNWREWLLEPKEETMKGE